MSAKLLCFGACFLALLGSLFGCGGQISSTPDSRQGQAVWVKPGSSAPTDAPVVRINSNNVASINLQKAADDLGLLPKSRKKTRHHSQEVMVSAPAPEPAPAAAPASKARAVGEVTHLKVDLILEEIQRKRLLQKPFDLTLIRSYVDAIIESDAKINARINLSDGTVLNLKNESAQLVQVLRSMISTRGTARVPIFDQKGKLLEYREFNIGGDLIDDLVNHQYVDESGAVCDKVLCVLASVFKPEIKETTAMPELATSPMDAAYEALYIAIHSRYIINLMVPRYPEDASEPENYRKKTKRFGVFTSDQVNLLAKTIWMLPSHFEGLSSLIFFSGDKKNGISVKQKIGHTTIKDGNYVGTHMHKTAGLPGTSYQFSSIGLIVLDLKSFGNYEIQADYYMYDYINGSPREVGRRSYTQEEVRNFMPDMREQLEQMDISVLVHELVHAFDMSERGRRIVEQGSAPRFFMHLPYNISTHKSWLDLSGWKKILGMDAESLPERWVSNRDFLMELSYNAEQRKTINNKPVLVADNTWTLDTNAKFPRAYGMVSPTEDFAVVAEKYIIDSEQLKRFEESTGIEGKKRIPAKYNFVANVLFTEIVDGRHYRYVYREKKFIESAIDQRDFLKQNVWMNCKDYDFRTQKWMTYKTSTVVVDGKSQIVSCDKILKN